MPLVHSDALADANMAGRQAFPPRRLRIRDRMSRRSVGTLQPLHAADETGSGHGASLPPRVLARVRPECQEPFVCVTAVMGAATGDDSDLN